MGVESKIEWTDASWTPIRAQWFEPAGNDGSRERVGWHCEHVSEGCRNCYSESINRRLGTGFDFKPGHLYRPERDGYHNGEAKLFLDETMLLAPLRWKRPRMIFVCSMTDLFADFVPDEWIDRVFAVMALCPQHVFQVLTKRSARMRRYLSAARAHPVGLAAFDETLRCMAANPRSQVGSGVILQGDIAHLKVWPLPNVWLGVSAEDQTRADERVPDLLATPAAVRFVSAEPLIAAIDFRDVPYPSPPEDEGRRGSALDGHEVAGMVGNCIDYVPPLDWIIVGGESGPKARPMQVAWARAIVQQCQSAGVACFVKQMGRTARMNRHDAVQAVALGSGWQADGEGAEQGIVSFSDRKGGDPITWPPDLRVREMPAAGEPVGRER